MLTLHPTFKQTTLGYLPMVTIRGERGQMKGCRAPAKANQDAVTYRTAAQAVSHAYHAALVAAYKFPERLKVA